MVKSTLSIRKDRLSMGEKNANDKAWYKEKINEIDTMGSSVSYNGITEEKRMQVNYDLYNGILNKTDFEYVCQPFGSEMGELPADMTNKDIVSARCKKMEGMEIKRPFPWKPLAVNRDASTRKEREEFGRIKEWVNAEVMRPIKMQIEQRMAKEQKGQDLTEKEQEQLQAQIQEELSAKTPDVVRRYMEREHQDPAEVLAHQILMYLMQEQRLPEKFQKGWKHVILSAQEVYFVGIIRDKPHFKVVNSKKFTSDRSGNHDFIEQGAWARAEYRYTPGEVVNMFGDELTTKEIDDLYEKFEYYAERGHIDHVLNWDEENNPDDDDNKFVRVVHFNFKAPRRIGFLEYRDVDGKVQSDTVDENYKLNIENGDISLEWEWFDETYEGYKIGSDMYKGLQPVPGQFKDEATFDICNLQYYGTIYDNMNSVPTAPMDRMKPFQYFHNIALYRAELLMASDKGKKLLMNLGNIPKGQGIDMKKWMYYFESTPYAWYTKDEEGQFTDANSVAKVVDMSLVSDISKYIEIADYLEKKCGKAVGLPDELVGQISPSTEVGNVKQAAESSSDILEPMFNLHNQVKRNALQAMIECAKVAYYEKDPGILSYILDDLSYKQFEVDKDLLDSSTFGIFVANSGKADAALQTIQTLGHAAMQNDKAELSDILAILRQDGTQEAEDILRASEKKKAQEAAQQAQQAQQATKELKQMEDAQKQKEHDWKLEEITLKENLQSKRELQKQAMLSMGFNEDKDLDNDGTPDVIELYKQGADVDIKNRELDIKEDQLAHDKVVDREELKIKKTVANKPKGK